MPQRRLPRHLRRAEAAEAAAPGVWGKPSGGHHDPARGADRLSNPRGEPGRDRVARDPAGRRLRGGRHDGPLRRGSSGGGADPSRPGCEPHREHAPRLGGAPGVVAAGSRRAHHRAHPHFPGQNTRHHAGGDRTPRAGGHRGCAPKAWGQTGHGRALSRDIRHGPGVRHDGRPADRHAQGGACRPHLLVLLGRMPGRVREGTTAIPESHRSLTAMRSAGVVLAAGSSRRMGSPKQGVTSLRYNHDSTLYSSTLTNSPYTLASWIYAYDGDYRITSQTFSGLGVGGVTPVQGTASYAYDGAGRISYLTLPGQSGQTVSWDHDGNRLTYQGVTYAYNMDDSIASAGGTSFTYFPTGTRRTDAAHFYCFDGYDRLFRATALTDVGCNSPTISYAYEGLDRQRAHSEGSGTTFMEYDGLSSTISAEYLGGGPSGAGTVYALAGSRRTAVGSYASGGAQPSSINYLADDGMGNISTAVTTGGSMACTAWSDAWGVPMSPLSSSNPCNTGSTLDTSFYTGSRRDQITGDYQFGVRTYDPNTGSFLEPDTYLGSQPGSQGSVVSDPLTMNRYVYVNGDPLNLIDPSGHMEIVNDSGGTSVSLPYVDFNTLGSLNNYPLTTTSTNYATENQQTLQGPNSADIWSWMERNFQPQGPPMSGGVATVTPYGVGIAIHPLTPLQPDNKFRSELNRQAVMCAADAVCSTIVLLLLPGGEEAAGSKGADGAAAEGLDTATAAGGRTLADAIESVPATADRIMPYIEAAKLTRGLDGATQAHHLVEVRHLINWGLDALRAPAVILDRGDHQALTNLLRKALPYGDTYGKSEVWNAYRSAYNDHPDWLKGIEKYFT